MHIHSLKTAVLRTIAISYICTIPKGAHNQASQATGSVGSAGQTMKS